MPIKIEKKKTGPERLPGYEVEGPLHENAKPLPWWLVFGMEIPPSPTNVRGEREGTLILASPMVVFRGYRLSVDPSIAPFFRILDIRVGRNSYSINGHLGAAATLFPPLPNGLSKEERADYEELLMLKLQAATPGQTMGLNVANCSAEKRYFSAILWGVGAE